jgi:hypothetical protein
LRGFFGDAVKTTLTTVHDSELGLPLDSVYRRELDALRASGRLLSETGLFADRREGIGRSVSALLNLMRLAFYFALRDDNATLVIGVHPHHCGFYERLFGFEKLGDVKSYGAVQGAAVVLLQLPLRERLNTQPAARGIAHFIEHPPIGDEFDARYGFPPDALRAGPLGGFFSSQPPPTPIAS